MCLVFSFSVVYIKLLSSEGQQRQASVNLGGNIVLTPPTDQPRDASMSKSTNHNTAPPTGNTSHGPEPPTGNTSHDPESSTGNTSHDPESPTGNTSHDPESPAEKARSHAVELYIENSNPTPIPPGTPVIHPSSDSDTSLLWYELVTWILLNIYVTVAFIITISYWIGVGFDLLAPAKSAASVNTHVHIINSVLAVIELSVGNLPIRILHFYQPVIFGFIYLVFTLILHWAGDRSAIYAVLDWMGGPAMAAGYALGILFIAVPFFHIFFSWGFFVLRIYCCEKYKRKFSGSKSYDVSDVQDTRL